MKHNSGVHAHIKIKTTLIYKLFRRRISFRIVSIKLKVKLIENGNFGKEIFNIQKKIT